MKRYGAVIGLRKEIIEEYKKYHAAVWPEVLAAIHTANIRNYSIYLRNDTLFAYYEYVGSDYKSDMAGMAANPKIKEWWAIMEPMQIPFEDRAPGDWWTVTEEVFHQD